MTTRESPELAPPFLRRRPQPQAGRRHNRSSENAERILAAGLELVAEGQGLRALTMRALAARCEMGPSELYRHVGDKDAILAGMQGLAAGQLERWLSACVLPMRGGDALESLCGGYVAFAQARPHVYAVLFGRPDSPVHAAGIRTFASAAIRILESSPRSVPDPVMAAQHLWVAMHGLVTVIIPGTRGGWCRDAAERDPRFVRSYIASVLRGIARSPVEPRAAPGRMAPIAQRGAFASGPSEGA
jgi:AcrR family transcriptional regulator